MSNMLFANNCNTTLNGGITAIATSLIVTSATGFPVPTGSQYFYCTLADAATQTTIEIVKVTAVSGTTFTIVRGQDGTTGTIFASGAVVSLRLVAASLNDFPKLDEANTFTGTITFSTPLLATNMVQSTTSTSGYLSNTDWNTFNGKAPAFTYTTGYVPYGQGTTTPTQSANLTFNGTQLATTRLLSSGDYATNAGDLTLTNTNGGRSWRIGDGIGGFPTSLIFWDSTGAAVRMAIGATGGVSIGNTTDPGATNLSVTGVIKIGANQAVNGPAFMAYASAGLSISTATFTKVRFNTTQIDTNSNFDTTNYRFTPTVSGYYQISSTVSIYGNTLTTGFTEICLYKNGSQYKFGNSIPIVLTTENQMVVSSLVYLNGSTDYIEIYVYQNSGSTLTIDSTSAYVWFSGAMVRGT